MNDGKTEDVNDIMETIRKAVIFGKSEPAGAAEAEAMDEPEPEPLLLADALPDDEPASDSAEPALAPPAATRPDVAPQPMVAAPAVIPGATTLEALVSAALEPLLKAWLDTHLPGIVEARVQAEIARLTAR